MEALQKSNTFNKNNIFINNLELAMIYNIFMRYPIYITIKDIFILLLLLFSK